MRQGRETHCPQPNLREANVSDYRNINRAGRRVSDRNTGSDIPRFVERKKICIRWARLQRDDWFLPTARNMECCEPV